MVLYVVFVGVSCCEDHYTFDFELIFTEHSEPSSGGDFFMTSTLGHMGPYEVLNKSVKSWDLCSTA